MAKRKTLPAAHAGEPIADPGAFQRRQQRSRMIAFRLTPAELDLVDAEAKRLKVERGDFIREALMRRIEITRRS